MLYNIWMGLRKTQTNWVTSTVSKRVKLHAASEKRKREEKTRGNSPFSRWSPLVKVSLVKFSPAFHQPRPQGLLSPYRKTRRPRGWGWYSTIWMPGKGYQIRKKWVEVPGAHAGTWILQCDYSNRDTWKKIIQLRFSKTKASRESWIFVGPFEKKLENLLFSKKRCDRIIFF